MMNNTPNTNPEIAPENIEELTAEAIAETEAAAAETAELAAENTAEAIAETAPDAEELLEDEDIIIMNPELDIDPYDGKDYPSDLILPHIPEDPDKAIDLSEANKKSSRSYKAAEKRSNALVYTVLILMSVIWLIPFVYLVCQAFRGESQCMVSYFFPKEWSLKNFEFLFKETNFLSWYSNTLIIALVVAVVQTVIVLAVSYSLSRLRFSGRKLLMNVMLVLGMFPGFLSMIALYYLLKLVGFTSEGSIPGLILVYVGSSGMGYYISKGFFDTIPKSLDEAAAIDGASRLRVFFSIIFPMAKPIIIYTVMMAFLAPWGDFMFASLITFGHEEAYNVAVGLYKFLDKEHITTYFTAFCAGGLLVAVPITILFMSLQKYYVEGVTGGAVKG